MRMSILRQEALITCVFILCAGFCFMFGEKIGGMTLSICACVMFFVMLLEYLEPTQQPTQHDRT